MIKKLNGFTLIEVMVVLSLSAFVFLLGSNLLHFINTSMKQHVNLMVGKSNVIAFEKIITADVYSSTKLQLNNQAGLEILTQDGSKIHYVFGQESFLRNRVELREIYGIRNVACEFWFEGEKVYSRSLVDYFKLTYEDQLGRQHVLTELKIYPKAILYDKEV